MLKRIIFLTLMLTTAGSVFFTPVIVVAQDDAMSRIEEGKAIAFNRFKGNCLACHHVEGGELTGNYGPPLIYMKARYPDRDALREQIWDASIKNPDTRMPPFGRNRILSEQEIDLVTDFIQSL
jgi:sulfur-oxidizing protein SoxX